MLFSLAGLAFSYLSKKMRDYHVHIFSMIVSIKSLQKQVIAKEHTALDFNCYKVLPTFVASLWPMIYWSNWNKSNKLKRLQVSATAQRYRKDSL